MRERAEAFSLREYLLLTKPGIVSLVLITTLGGLYLGARGELEPGLVFWTLLGTGLGAAGSAVLNMVLDRDIDAVMSRTAHRPLARGTAEVKKALLFGLTLQALSMAVLLYFVGVLPALLVGLASFTYTVIYSSYLKRRSWLATEIGGVSGALPPVVGYAAASGTLDANALALFLLMLVWQPPHFWALAIKYRDDYARAGVPVLPVSKGIEATKRRTLLYALVTVPVSLLPYATGLVGEVYLFVALALNALYLAVTLQFYFSDDERKAVKLFFFSVLYLALLFGTMTFDAVR
ncbi:MAG: protoheme IX farnesyltransferase [Aquificae bacterium]|nr:protoheme IX farnesyltransferase [Aquificota bacterium]